MRLPIVSAVTWLHLVSAGLAFTPAQALAGPQGQSPRRSELDYRPPAVAAPRLGPLGSARGEQPAGESPNAQSDFALIADTNAARPGSPSVAGEGPLTATELNLLVSPGHLNDVEFIDAKVGVAVGNQGLIWRTTDGGRRWSPIRCEWAGDLFAITFANEQTGWIVGGRTLPVRGLHEGVVLRTQDGGVTWRRLSTAILPRLTSVAYHHQQRKLWVVGDGDGQFPSGLFESYDLGQNWSDVPVKFSDALPNAALGALGSPSPSTVAPRGWASPATVACCLGDQWIVSNSLGIFRTQNGRTTLGRFESTAGDAAAAPRFRQVLPVGSRLMAIGEDGRLYRSKNQGEKWERVAWPQEQEIVSNSAAERPDLAIMAAAGESLWAASRVGRQILHFEGRTQTWQTQQFPGTFQCNALYFADERLGWAVGPLGNVLSTTDGGRNWQWLHRSHPGLAVLILAADSRDVPPELLAHLATNQGLNVGVLMGHAHLPPAVIEQAWALNDVSTTLFDSLLFDTRPTPALAQYRIDRYLEAFQPKILLVCPPDLSRMSLGATPLQVPVNQWLEAIQARNASGIGSGVAMIATLSSDAETSTSSASLATHVGRLLGDLCWPSQQLLAAWEDPAQEKIETVAGAGGGPGGNSTRTVGVRRLVSLESTQLSWFNARSALKDPTVAALSLRPVRSRTSATNLDSISRMTSKANWVHQMTQVETRSPESRAQWQRALTLSLSHLPEPVHAVWLADLAQHCQAAADPRKATLARWELLQSFLDSPAGLGALLPTLQWLISDEAQWENRSEDREARQQKFAELQRLFAQEDAEGPLSDEERKSRALRRFGLDPELESQVPAEIVERILLLDQVQRQAARDGKLSPDPETARLAAVPQSRILTEQQTRQYQNRAGQYNHHSTVLTWDTPLLPEQDVAFQTTHSHGGLAAGKAIVDLSHIQRLDIADGLIRRADSLWPGLSGLPQWWLLKAQVKRQRQDIVQTEMAWNRLAEMAADPLVVLMHQAILPSPAVIATEKYLALAKAEAGERFDIRSLDSTRFVKKSGSSPEESRQRLQPQVQPQVQVVPVTWTLQRPYLDGYLDESWWTADTAESVALCLAQDEQYLYIAIQVEDSSATTVTTEDHPQRQSTRPMPASTGRDVVNLPCCLSLMIDTDGDTSESFRIDIDSAGRIRDQQGSHQSWNPKLFVAQVVHDGVRTIEMAIDLEDLALVRAGQPWRFKLAHHASAARQPWLEVWGQLSNLLD